MWRQTQTVLHASQTLALQILLSSLSLRRENIIAGVAADSHVRPFLQGSARAPHMKHFSF